MHQEGRAHVCAHVGRALGSLVASLSLITGMQCARWFSGQRSRPKAQKKLKETSSSRVSSGEWWVVSLWHTVYGWCTVRGRWQCNQH